MRGVFGGDTRTPKWCSRRLVEQARRRELAHARSQIEAVGLDRFSRFLERWQHLTPTTRIEGDDDTTEIVRQMYGLARPAELWERELFPVRTDRYDPAALSRLMALGEMVWIGGSATKPDEPPNLSTVRFVRRGTARAWLAQTDLPPLGEHAQRVLAALERDGASFFDELVASATVTSRQLRDALRELAGAGLVTNDSIDTLRLVLRWRPMISPRDRAQPDPTRWLPADFSPSANRYVVQRRPNLRRMPKWKRPDREGAAPESWPGRWSLVRTPRVLGPEVEESAWAEIIARQWLARYGIVSREIWRRERPAISWRAIYHELKRLEFRGDVRRGYFISGLSGAQFALPEAVEQLRAGGAAEDDDAPIVISASDPANVFNLPLTLDAARDAFVRPRSRGALLVTIAGVVVLIAERRGERVAVRPGVLDAEVTRAAAALLSHLAARSSRDVTVETLDGQPASGSPHADAFQAAGFRRTTGALRFYRAV